MTDLEEAVKKVLCPFMPRKATINLGLVTLYYGVHVCDNYNEDRCTLDNMSTSYTNMRKALKDW